MRSHRTDDLLLFCKLTGSGFPRVRSLNTTRFATTSEWPGNWDGFRRSHSLLFACFSPCDANVGRPNEAMRSRENDGHDIRRRISMTNPAAPFAYDTDTRRFYHGTRADLKPGD